MSNFKKYLNKINSIYNESDDKETITSIITGFINRMIEEYPILKNPNFNVADLRAENNLDKKLSNLNSEQKKYIKNVALLVNFLPNNSNNENENENIINNFITHLKKYFNIDISEKNLNDIKTKLVLIETEMSNIIKKR